MKNRKLKNRELGRKSKTDFKEAPKTPVSVVLDNIRSSHNVGSVFRTADAFVLEKLYLCGITATPPHRDIRKTAIGATETVDWAHTENAVEQVKELKAAGKFIIAIEQAEDSVELQNFELPGNDDIAIVFGHEVKGVQQEIVSLSDEVVEIPQFGSKHSLNISVSAGLVLWDVFKQMNYKP